MWSYDKRLQYPVNIKNPDPQIAKIVITQLGGPDGEIGAAMRYLNQRYAMPYKIGKAILTDVGTSAAELRISCHGRPIGSADTIFTLNLSSLPEVS